MRSEHDAPLGSHGFGAWIIDLFIRLVLEGVSLRGASRVLEMLAGVLGWTVPTPHWTTGRLWLLRLGHATLTAQLQLAADWVWLIDHSAQIGQEKCLIILGIRVADLPPRGQCLRYEDMTLVSLVVARSWSGVEVDEALETAVARAGHVPRAIVNDHGADVKAGVALFQQRHPETVDLYDTKHKAACLLKHRLEKSPRWQEFQTAVGRTRGAVQQTELAFLEPSASKSKARFMNLGPQLKWAKNMLTILRAPPPCVLETASASRLQEKFGWLEGFANEIDEWSQWQQVIDTTVTSIGEQGLHRGAARLLVEQIPQRRSMCPSSRALTAELVGFVRDQERRTNPGERLPASTEILESCFGRFKELEKQQSRGGFTQLVLGFGAFLTQVTADTVKTALQSSRTADVRDWARQTFGRTLFSQRKAAFSSATKTG